jgi:REP-associated tyrosine transposase
MRKEEHPTAKPARGAYRRNLPHLQVAGKTYFVTFGTQGRRQLPAAVRSKVLDACVHDHGSKYALHAAVVMPDHVHLLFTPLQDADGTTYGLAELMHGIKGSSSHAVNRHLKRRGTIWQSESFDRLLRSDESVAQKAEYICENPVRAGLVERVDEWPWIWRAWVEDRVRDTIRR